MDTYNNHSYLDINLDKSLTGTLLPERTTRLFLYYVFLHPA